MRLLLIILSVCLLALGANAGASPHTVGYVGCSNTSLEVEGYEALGGTSFWMPSGSYHSIPALTYSGGTVLNWQNDSSFFKQFDAFNKDRPASVIWFQVCQFTWESSSASSAAALSDLNAIHARAPTATVYVSALGGYTRATCRANNVWSSSSIRDQLLRLRYPWVRRGPEMPALSPSQVFADGCHPNLAGQASTGQALLGFDWSASPPGGSAPTIGSFAPTSGPIGSQVVITGTNFTNVTSVQLVKGSNSKNAVFTVASPTQITATVPSGVPIGGSGNWKVTTSTGGVISAGLFTVT